jgi:hypothetical protein
MSDFFTAAQRRMQEKFEATSLANRIEEAYEACVANGKLL